VSPKVEQSVTVFRTKDPVEGELVLGLLTQEGVDARLLGTRNAALIGVAANVFDLKIEVPREDADEAAEIIDAYVKGERAQPDGDDAGGEAGGDEAGGDEAGGGEAGGDEAGDDEPPRRRPLLAAGASLLVPGGGHFYARRIVTGLVIVLGHVGGFAALAQGAYVESTCGWLIIVGLIAADLAGGQFAVRAWNRGARPSAWRELAAGALLVALVYGAGVAIGTHLPPPKPRALPYYYLPR